jgi:hypothetical protein
MEGIMYAFSTKVSIESGGMISIASIFFDFNKWLICHSHLFPFGV